MSHADLIRRLRELHAEVQHWSEYPDYDLDVVGLSADALEAAEAEVARLKDQIYESIPKWQANELQRKLDAAEVEVTRLKQEAETRRMKQADLNIEWASKLGEAHNRAKTAEARAERAEADLKVAQVWHDKAQDFLRQMREAEARAERAEEALRLWDEAFATGRSEPLFIARDAGRAALEAKP